MRPQSARPAGQKQHVRSGQGTLAVAPRNFLDEDRLAAAAINAPHGVEQKNQKSPERNELESPFGELIVTRRRLMATRTDRRRTLTRPYGDLNGWPRSWMGLEKDLPPGEQLLTLFRPFLENLAASDLSPKTIQKHVDNMWALGGEFIRDLNYDQSLRKRPVEQHLLEMIEDGGPLLYDGGEDLQRSFDSTCRKFHPFPPATAP